MAVFMTDAIQKTMFDVRNAIENKIHHLPVSYFDQEKRESYYHVSQMMWIHYRMRVAANFITSNFQLYVHLLLCYS